MKSKRIGKWLPALAMLVCAMAGQIAYGAENDQKTKISGLIITRTGDTLTIKTREAGNVVVVITDDTKVQMPKGVGIRKERMSFTALIPGLRVTVEGMTDAKNQLVARTITFSKDDLKTAEQIQAGLVTTQQDVATNKDNIVANQEKIAANKAQIDANREDIEAANKRFNDLTEFDVKGESTVYFKSGSAAISPKHKAELKDLAHQAVNMKGYIIQVKGFADSSGSAEMNQKLSMDRAEAVVAYLLQECNVPQRHVVAPGAMGESSAVAEDESARGRAEDRRVEVKLLVNRGLAGQP